MFGASTTVRVLCELRRIIRRDWCILDCGTYLGFYTCFFAAAVGKSGRVVAIEPDPRNLERTMRNVALNGLTNVIPVNVAVGAPAGEVDFLLLNDSNSHLPSCYVGNTAARPVWTDKDLALRRVKVRCISLDELLFNEALPRGQT